MEALLACRHLNDLCPALAVIHPLCIPNQYANATGHRYWTTSTPWCSWLRKTTFCSATITQTSSAQATRASSTRFALPPVVHDKYKYSVLTHPCVVCCPQLCVRLGFPRSNFGYILTGEISEVLEAYPNFGHLRDIIFLFHLLMAPSGDDLPDLRLWKPSDAQLNWTFDDDKGCPSPPLPFPLLPATLTSSHGHT